MAALLASVLLVLGVSASHLQAQQMQGQVVRSTGPLEEGMVFLHLVTPDSAWQVDSTGIRPEGRFDFVLDRLDDESNSQIYFASIRHQGVLYFGEAVATTAQLDSTYTIEVHDARVAPSMGVPLPLSIRNVIFAQDADGSWMVTDLFRVLNADPQTIVAADSGLVWSHPLPEGATDFDVSRGGDLTPDAISFENGRLIVRSPMPPGERTVLVRYRMAALPIDIPVTATTNRLDLLVREPAPPLRAPPLQPFEAVEVDGETYRFYSIQQTIGQTFIRVEETEPPTRLPVGWITVALALLLGGAGLWIVRRPAPATAGAPAAAARPSSDRNADRQRLILEIARLDIQMEGLPPDSAERTTLAAERNAKLEAIRSLS